MHDLIQPAGYYQPNIQEKKQWRRTRKDIKKINKDLQFGLYNTTLFGRDKFLFYLAICILEPIGTLALLYAAGVFNFFLFGGLLFGIFLDIIFAKWGHWFAGNVRERKCLRCVAKYYSTVANQFKAANPNRTDLNPTIDGFDRQSRKYRNQNIRAEIFHWIGHVFIILLACLKIFYFTKLWGLGINSITLGVSVLYLCIAYIHIFHTAYFLAENHFRNKIKKDSENFSDEVNSKHVDLRSTDVAMEMFGPPHTLLFREFELNRKHEIISCTSNRHSINIDNNDIVCLVWGLLQDDDLYQMSKISQTDNGAKETVAIKLLELQLMQLSSAAYRPK